MPDCLLLRFDAVLQSFGAPIVDQHGVTSEFPALSLLTGLLANALGYEHCQTDALQALQERIRYAVRCDRPGVRLRDYQTVDLGQRHLVGTGWTTRGRVQERAGGSAKEATHIRYRDFHADAVFTVALLVAPPREPPDLDALQAALQEPERPLFLGRKPCIPSAPVFLSRVDAPSLASALCSAPLLPRTRRTSGPMLRAWVPEQESRELRGSRTIAVFDRRDWRNQLHTGRRLLCEGAIQVEEAADAR